MGAKRVTFGPLSRALKSLGFEEKTGRGQAHFFRHPGTRALIALPRMADTAAVSPRLLAAVGKTLEHFEIADVLEFGALLQLTAPAAAAMPNGGCHPDPAFSGGCAAGSDRIIHRVRRTGSGVGLSTRARRFSSPRTGRGKTSTARYRSVRVIARRPGTRT